jgi:ABC-type glycerol-3-phosphate transport system substrate-binding protein
MKKLLLIGLAVLLVSAHLFAAGSSQGGTARSGKEKIIWYVWDDPALMGYNDIAAEFTKANPDIEVEVQYIAYDRYEDKVRTTLAGGDVPDVVQINDDFVNMYTNRGLLLPLDNYVKNLNLNPNDYYKSVWDFNFVNGQMMAFSPMNKVRLIVYNKDILKAAGIPEPSTTWGDPAWNWDILKDYAVKTTKREGNVTTQWGFLWEVSGTDQIWTSCANGEGLIGDDGKTAAGTNAGGKEAVQYLADTILTWKVSPALGDHPNNLNVFLSGQAAFMVGISSSFSNYRQNASFDWDVAPIPVKKYSLNEGSLVCFGIPKNSKHADAAAKFLFFLGEDFAQKTFATQGNVPINKSYAQKYYNQPGQKPLRMQVVLDGMDHNKSVTYGDYTDEAKRAYRAYLNRVLAGEMQTGPAMDQAKVEVEAALAGKR